MSDQPPFCVKHGVHAGVECPECRSERSASASSNQRLESLRQVAAMIERRPVLGHWPHMRAAPDAADVRWAADEIERLQALDSVQRSIERNTAYEQDLDRLTQRVVEIDRYNTGLAEECEQLRRERDEAQERFEDMRDVVYNTANVERDRLRAGIQNLQSTCCGDSAEKCHGCRALLGLLSGERIPDETTARLSAKLDELAALPHDWDTYGGIPPLGNCLAKARQLAALLPAGHWDIVPGSDGSLQIEQHAGGLDIELHICSAEKASVPRRQCHICQAMVPDGEDHLCEDGKRRGPLNVAL